MNKNLFAKNREKLFAKLPENSLAIINSNDEMPRNGDQLFKFRQNSDLFYLTGINQPKTILLISPDNPNENFREILFTTQPTELFSTWYGHQADKNELTSISGIKNIMWLEDFEITLKDLMINAENVFLSSNEYIKFIPDFPDRNHRFILELKEKYPLHSYKRLAPILAGLRLIKEPEEIAAIQKACDITAKAFERVLKQTKPDIYEFQIEAEISYEFTVNAADAHAYYPIIASGENACTLHYIENRGICKNGDLLLMDFGCEINNYASDCSRTIPVNGKFTERQKACYQSVLTVYNEILTHFVVGNTIDNLNKETNRLIEKELVKLGLFSEADIIAQNIGTPLFKKYFMHGVSHFLGLDVHDVGSKQIQFQEGMILTCEPGIYIKEEKMGIRLENDILITKDGPVNLMKNIPMEIEEIEKIMQNR
jgi:Xaa-Pro aminopeptidase